MACRNIFRGAFSHSDSWLLRHSYTKADGFHTATLREGECVLVSSLSTCAAPTQPQTTRDGHDMGAQPSPNSACSQSCRTCPPPPFSVRPLHRDGDTFDARPSDDELLSLLPASYLTKSDDLVAASRDVKACLEKELDLRRLTNIMDWLWLVGRPSPPRPLHHQVLLSRDVFITERIDMHLVWTAGQIFLKPLPRFLLEPRFWIYHLSCAHSCRCPAEDGSPGVCADKAAESPEGASGNVINCRERLWKCALGFLFSYAALITHEADFSIAKEKLLLPPEVTWQAWRALVYQLNTEHIYPHIDPRFVYGELRLSRLNKIYYLLQTPLRGYRPRWQQYGTYFRDNLAWVASATIYIAIVLTAMQVGLATDALVESEAFQSASYGFAVFSITGPLVAVGLIIVVFCCLFVNNWVASITYRKKRFHSIREARWSRSTAVPR